MQREVGQKISAQELIGFDSFTRYGMKGQYGELISFAVMPTNIAVLSNENVEQKVKMLTTALSSISNVEICAFDAYENFDENKAYMHRRIAEETNEKICEILKKEVVFVENVQLEMSASRLYAVVLRFLKKENDEQIFQTTSRVQKVFEDQGFQLKKLEKSDLKRLLANYFDASYNGENIEDVEGSGMKCVGFRKVVRV